MIAEVTSLIEFVDNFLMDSTDFVKHLNRLRNGFTCFDTVATSNSPSKRIPAIFLATNVSRAHRPFVECRCDVLVRDKINYFTVDQFLDPLTLHVSFNLSAAALTSHSQFQKRSQRPLLYRYFIGVTAHIAQMCVTNVVFFSDNAARVSTILHPLIEIFLYHQVKHSSTTAAISAYNNDLYYCSHARILAFFPWWV